MAYYIYRITSPKKLELIETKEKYQDAKVLVRHLRANMQAEDDFTIRMIFAKTTQEAEKLLSIPRDERVIGED